jgi:DNA-binding MarR family transcriptional regulator
VPGDSIDRLLADWGRERADLDFAPIGIVSRLARLRTLLDAGLQHVFDRYDLSPADFVVVVSLRRAGAPYRVAQVGLAGRLGLTPGTVSVRVDRLAARGIVVRESDDADRRVQLVRLTEAGLALFDEIAPVHLANEDRLLSALAPAERADLTDLLRILLSSLECTSGSFRALGLELLESPIARSRRAAVGLSDPPGLLVAAAPAPGSPAASAGLQQGDLITEVDGRRIRNGLAFAAVLKDGGDRPTTRSCTLLRGEQSLILPITFPAHEDQVGPDG